jgi:hypothetical protein
MARWRRERRRLDLGRLVVVNVDGDVAGLVVLLARVAVESVDIRIAQSST